MLEEISLKDRSLCLVVKQSLFEWLTTQASRLGIRKSHFALGLLKDGVRTRMTMIEILRDLEIPYNELRLKYMTELMEERKM